MNRTTYRWFYDAVHSRYYDILVRWCFLPFGGEVRCRADLVARAGLEPGTTVLDMACGTGSATGFIARAVGEAGTVVGLDLSWGQIRRAAGKEHDGDVRFLVGDAAAACFRDETFDAVLVTHALHEMPRVERLAVLGEARRLLRDGARVVVLELDDPPSRWLRLFVGLWFFYWLPFNFETPTRRDMQRHGLAREVQAAGFRNVTATPVRGGVFQVVAGER